MPEIDLQTAVQEIVASTASKRPRGEFPFFLIVGAGISYPQIPLASGIETRCREKLTDAGSGADLSLEGKTPLDRYETLFKKAYPQSEDRQEFLHDLIHRAPISAANFRLAHLLGELQLTNLVFTPNFDEMLSRALRLLGYDVVVCDHPKTTGRVRLMRQNLQVVHVHGTHWFYDCCNLRAEMEGRSRRDVTDGLTMGQLLDRVLADRSPVVVGYSGWKGDVIMAALERRLQQPTLPCNLYWFCFNRRPVEDPNALPSELKDHPSVRLVLPPPPPPLMDNKKRKLEGQLPSERMAGERLEDEPTLAARDVFEAFLRRLDLRAPRLTSEPLDFFLEHMTQNLSSEEEDEITDPYSIRDALSRIREGARLEREQGTNAKNIANHLLAQLNDAVRRSDYAKAIEAAQEMNLPKLIVDQRVRLDEALEKVSLGTSDAEQKIAACDIRLKLAKTCQDMTEVETTDWNRRTVEASRELASALAIKGFALAQAGRTGDAIAAYDEVERRFSEATDPALRLWIARALVDKGVALGQARRTGDEVAAYDEVERRFGEAAEPALRERVAKALVNKGFTLWQDEQPDEAVAAYEEVEGRFREAAEPFLREWAAKANYELSAIFLSQGHLQEGLIAARRGVDLGGDHYNLAFALARNGELDEAFSELEHCLTSGEISREHVLQDPDWEHLRDHPKFRELTNESASQ
jgi:tetratricopeptide (TPR) repeat protein